VAAVAAVEPLLVAHLLSLVMDQEETTALLVEMVLLHHSLALL
jgi:hypothetical protein